MNSRLNRVLTYSAVLMGLFGAITLLMFGTSGQIKAQSPEQTTLRILALKDQGSKGGATISAQLMSETGKALMEQTVALWVDGREVGQTVTNELGQLKLMLDMALSTGMHIVELKFPGAAGMAPAQVRTTFFVQSMPTNVTNQSILTFGPIPQIASGALVSLTLQLQTEAGEAVPNAPVAIALDGKTLQSVQTDAVGGALIPLPPDLLIGPHTLKTQFSGIEGVSGTSALVQLTVAPPSPVTLLIEPVDPVKSGAPVTVTVHLRNKLSDEPIAKAQISLLLEGVLVGRTQTGENGRAQFFFANDLAEKIYVLQANFDGAPGVSGAVDTAALMVEPPPRLQLELQPIPPDLMGDATTVTAWVRSPDNVAIQSSKVKFYLDENLIEEKSTSIDGQVQFQLPAGLAPATYGIKLVAENAPLFRATTVMNQFVIKPIESTIQVVPPLAGVRFALNGRPLTTDANGRIRLTVDKPGLYDLEILSKVDDNKTYRIEFDRWQAEVFEAQRQVYLPQETPIQVGFGVSYRPRQRFVDAEGRLIDPQRISSLTFQSSQGGTITIRPGEQPWLQANRIMRRSTGLEVVPILYSLQSVTIDGTNVVNRGQQKFSMSSPTDEWTIELIFYAATFRARDALLGSSIGSGVNLTYPNGEQVYSPFNEQGEVALVALARGLYKAEVVGAWGLTPVTPVVISKLQEIELRVISYLDITLISGGVLLAAFVLLLMGRPGLFAYLRHREEEQQVVGRPLLLPLLDTMPRNLHVPQHVQYSMPNGRQRQDHINAAAYGAAYRMPIPEHRIRLPEIGTPNKMRPPQ